MSNLDATKRFSNRANDYVKYRPGYPVRAIRYLCERGINADAVVADVGSGTGILSKLLIPYARHVFGVEPNAAMRSEAEEVLGRLEKFTSIAGTAEDTGLPDSFIDVIVVAHAFHWFDQEAAVKEFKRIAKKPALLAVLWNTRLDDTLFLRDYENLLETFGTDYRQVDHRKIEERQLEEYFLSDFEKQEFGNEQVLDKDGLKGRLLSCSYVPKPGETDHDQLIRRAEEIFDEHQENGAVVLRYSTQVYSGLI